MIDCRDNHLYKTVKIGNQCWMGENLNIGTMATSNNTGVSHSDVSDNDVIEKYCYNNDENNCKKYGGLYDWNEMMNYMNQESGQGICPYGFHIPTDAEWFTLENFVDGSIDDPYAKSWRGTDGGTKLKEKGSSGFEILLNGIRYNIGSFGGITRDESFWTSTLTSSTTGTQAYFRGFNNNINKINRYSTDLVYGLSVRCIKNK
jgi:uncharacterized protein (TIGR02145 family)